MEKARLAPVYIIVQILLDSSSQSIPSNSAQYSFRCAFVIYNQNWLFHLVAFIWGYQSAIMSSAPSVSVCSILFYLLLIVCKKYMYVLLLYLCMWVCALRLASRNQTKQLLSRIFHCWRNAVFVLSCLGTPIPGDAQSTGTLTRPLLAEWCVNQWILLHQYIT